MTNKDGNSPEEENVIDIPIENDDQFVRLIRLSSGEDVIGVMHEHSAEHNGYPIIDPFLLATMTNPDSGMMNTAMLDYVPFSDVKIVVLNAIHIVNVTVPYAGIIEFWKKTIHVRDRFFHPTNKLTIEARNKNMDQLIAQMLPSESETDPPVDETAVVVANTVPESNVIEFSRPSSNTVH